MHYLYCFASLQKLHMGNLIMIHFSNDDKLALTEPNCAVLKTTELIHTIINFCKCCES